MSDREKVIKGLECCMKWTGEPNTVTCHCSDCSYTNMDILGQRCLIDLINDALAMLTDQQEQIDRLIEENASNAEMADGLKELLKEQEAVKPVLDEQTGRIWLCGNCGSYVGFEDNDPHDPNEFDKYCRECGRPVLWEGR